MLLKSVTAAKAFSMQRWLHDFSPNGKKSERRKSYHSQNALSLGFCLKLTIMDKRNNNCIVEALTAKSLQKG